MKNKMILMGLAIAITFTIASCKKDYTCKCSKIYPDTTGTGSVTKDDGSYIFKDNKARADDECNNQEKTGSDLNGKYSRQCQIQ